MTPNQTLAELTSRCVTGLDRVIKEVNPSCVVGQGDTTTVFAAALSAFYNHVGFAHVEAGLRSGDMQSPWPEEFNRVAVGRLATLHFPPTKGSALNLEKEGVPGDRVYVTGNTVIDAVDMARSRITPYAMDGFAEYALITVHRRENFGPHIRSIVEAVKALSQRFPDFGFLWPVHPNPNVFDTVHAELAQLPNVKLVSPMEYVEFLSALAGCAFALSDSGGVQEEAPSFGKPVLVLRKETERPEGVDAGVARLVGVSSADIIAQASGLISDPAQRQAMRVPVSPYGDGKAAERIVEALQRHYGDGA